MSIIPKVKFNTVQEYLSVLPAKHKKALGELRKTIKENVPAGSEELISYNIPAFKWNGMLVYYSAWTNHISMYPVPRGDAAFKKELAPYQAGKGTIRFAMDKPIPAKLVAKIVKLRTRENLERAAMKKKK